MRDLDSYLMGVFDGEGSISTSFEIKENGRKCLRVRICVGMGNAEVIAAFKKRFGGGSGTYRMKSGKPIHQWWTSSHRATPFLQVAAALCIEKAEQARLALRLVELVLINAPGGKRARGSVWITPAQLAERESLVEQITKLKNKPPRSACNA